MTIQQAIEGTYLDINNLQLSYVTTTTLGVAAGRARDSGNDMDIVLQTAVVITGTVNGANGLDVGSLANNTWYNVWLLGDPLAYKQPCAVVSLASSAVPYLPAGYGSYRRIGRVKTDGSAHFLPFTQSGRNSERFYQWDVPIAVLTGGSSATFAAVDASVGAPPSASPIYLNIAYTPVTAASTGSIRATGSAAAAGSCPINLKGNVNAVAFNANMVKILPSAVASIDYIVTASDALTLKVAAFEDLL